MISILPFSSAVFLSFQRSFHHFPFSLFLHFPTFHLSLKSAVGVYLTILLLCKKDVPRWFLRTKLGKILTRRLYFTNITILNILQLFFSRYFFKKRIISFHKKYTVLTGYLWWIHTFSLLVRKFSRKNEWTRRCVQYVCLYKYRDFIWTENQDKVGRILVLYLERKSR